jgi:hypothetical protein
MNINYLVLPDSIFILAAVMYFLKIKRSWIKYVFMAAMFLYDVCSGIYVYYDISSLVYRSVLSTFICAYWFLYVKDYVDDTKIDLREE